MQQTIMVVGLLVALLAGPAGLGAQPSSTPTDLDVEALLGALQRDEQAAPPPRQDETLGLESGGATPSVRDLYESAWRAAAQAARGVDLEHAWQTLCQQLATSTVALAHTPSPTGGVTRSPCNDADIPTLCRQYSRPDAEQVRHPAGQAGGPPATAR
jgi:hypothetical protein